MIACNVHFTTQELQNNYAERFVNSLNATETEFCINYLKGDKK